MSVPLILFGDYENAIFKISLWNKDEIDDSQNIQIFNIFYVMTIVHFYYLKKEKNKGGKKLNVFQIALMDTFLLTANS